MIKEIIQEAKGWTDFKKDMKKIVKKYQKYTAEADSVPTSSGYGNSTARATRGGFIRYEEDVTSHGYSFNTHVYVGIKVGGKVDYKIHEKISNEVKKLIDKSPTLIIGGDTKIMFHEKSGTNWSIYGVREGGKI